MSETYYVVLLLCMFVLGIGVSLIFVSDHYKILIDEMKNKKCPKCKGTGKVKRNQRG